jgi:hypothetical protein
VKSLAGVVILPGPGVTIKLDAIEEVTATGSDPGMANERTCFECDGIVVKIIDDIVHKLLRHLAICNFDTRQLIVLSKLC